KLKQHNKELSEQLEKEKQDNLKNMTLLQEKVDRTAFELDQSKKTIVLLEKEIRSAYEKAVSEEINHGKVLGKLKQDQEQELHRFSTETKIQIGRLQEQLLLEQDRTEELRSILQLANRQIEDLQGSLDRTTQHNLQLTGKVNVRSAAIKKLGGLSYIDYYN